MTVPIRRFRAQDGLLLAYRRFGPASAARPAVVCLPGLARNGRDFLCVAARLAARGHPVLCPDYRGRGASARDPDWRNYRPGVYLNDLKHLLILEGVHRAVFVGTSMGGLMAMAMGAAMPSAVAGALINDIGPDMPESGVGRIVDYVGRDWPQPDWPAAIACLKEMMPDIGLATEADWRRFAEATFVAGEDGLLHADWDPRIAEPLRRGAALPDLWALFGTLARVPVCIVRGGRSNILSAETQARMGAAHGAARLVTIETAGHTPTLEEPACREALDDLLDASAAA